MVWNNPGVRENPNRALTVPHRPMPARPLEVSGAFSHGAPLVITDAFGRFGFKTLAAPRTWVYGSDMRTKGVLGSDSEVWGGTEGNITLDPTLARTGNIDGAYLSLGYGVKSDPVGFADVPASSVRLFLSWWQRKTSDYVRTYVCPIQGAVTGTFQTGPYRGRGEQVTLTKVGQSDLQAYVTFVDGGYITIEAISVYGFSTTAIAGCQITGQSSGATCLVASSGVGGSGAGKYFRSMHGAVGERRTTAIFAHTSSGLVDVDYAADGGVSVNDNSVSDTSNVFATRAIDQWFQVNVELDWSGDTGRVSIWRDNQLLHHRTDYLTDYLGLPNRQGWRPTLIGLDVNGLGGTPFESVGLGQMTSEIYADSSLARVAIGDAATLDTCIELAWQRPTLWHQDRIEVVGNAGGITGSRYLYVWNDAGECINANDGILVP